MADDRGTPGARILDAAGEATRKTGSLMKEFRDFVSRGNVIDLAIGVIIGGAFGKIVTSLVNDVLMPPLGVVCGRLDFRQLTLKLADGRDGKPVTLNYGAFLNTMLDFLIVALVVFLLMRTINALSRKPAPAAAPTKECPLCTSAIPIKAVKCPQCTGDLRAA